MSAGLITTQQFCKNKCLFDKHQRFLLKLLNLANLITESQQKYKRCVCFIVFVDKIIYDTLSSLFGSCKFCRKLINLILERLFFTPNWDIWYDRMTLWVIKQIKSHLWFEISLPQNYMLSNARFLARNFHFLIAIDTCVHKSTSETDRGRTARNFKLTSAVRTEFYFTRRCHGTALEYCNKIRITWKSLDFI